MRAALVAAAITAVGLAPGWAVAETAVPEDRSAKEANDPLPPTAMPRPAGPEVPTPRGTPEGMGNESDGVDEPGRNPVPGLPREAPGANKP
jgi:hypothetical protein